MVRVVVLVGLAAVGFGAGRWLRTQETDVVPGPAPEVEPSAAAPVPELQGDPCDHVPLVEALLARTSEQIEGVPRPFPDDPSLQPAEFHRLLDAMLLSCPDMVVDHVDCDEYPCLAWARNVCVTDPLASFTAAIDTVTLGDGRPTRWGVVSLASPDEGNASAPPHGSDADVRLQTRTLRAREAIEDATGARPMTEVEIWTHQVQNLEDMLEGEGGRPEDRAVVEEALAESQAQLDRALQAERGQ